ncbi:MAG: SurA N-terminal domain-containing protein [Alistipes sp.]|nr:SurA N-terminal domain-containing protein [Alistipes sp.]
MASLNTLRTKYGVILSVVIILALLAFIISLGPEMGFFGSNDPTVGVINGEKVGYMEYMNEYETIKTYNGGDESTEEGSNALANAAWQALVAKHLLVPGFNEMGIEVSDAERMAMISGEHPSQVFYNAFADPQTGEYSVENITAFLAQVSANPEYQNLWSYLNSQASLNRMLSKYMGVVKAGTFVNKLEVEQGVVAANESRNGRMVSLEYNTIADSLVTISDAEIQKYYDTHKKEFAKLPHRAISYVVFDVDPTDADMLDIEKKATTMGEEFAAAEDVRAFVRKNMGTVGVNYQSAAQLSEEEAVLLDGKQYGPVLKANEWVISRPIDIKMAPDSIGLNHIVLDPAQTALADSLMTALKGGADFAEAAKTHSGYAATAQAGGDLGVIPFSALNPELAEALATAKKGDIVKATVSGVTQILKVTRTDAAKKHVLVGTVTIPVEPSSATRRDVHNVASVFSVDGKGSLDKFNAAANAAAVTPRIARIAQGDRTIAGLENSREVTRWAYGAKVEEISEIFNLGNAYVVAMLTEIDDSEYTSIDEARTNISLNLLRDKKFELIKEKLAGATIEDVAKTAGAEVKPFEGVQYNDFGVGELMLEPRLVGAIATTKETGKLSAPVKGFTNAVVFVVDNIVKSETQTAEAEKVRLQATNENVASQSAVMALQNMAEMEDLRGQYF